MKISKRALVIYVSRNSVFQANKNAKHFGQCIKSIVTPPPPPPLLLFCPECKIQKNIRRLQYSFTCFIPYFCVLETRPFGINQIYLRANENRTEQRSTIRSFFISIITSSRACRVESRVFFFGVVGVVLVLLVYSRCVSTWLGTPTDWT